MARVLGPLHVTGVFWYRLHAFAARGPDWLLAALLPLFTLFFFSTLFAIRRAVAGNLEAVLGRCGWWRRQRRIWRTLHAFAWSLTERYQRLLTDRPFTVEVEGLTRWRAALDGGRGCVMVTAHLGNWEMASALPVEREARPVHLVREPEMDPAAQAFIAGRLGPRSETGYTTHFAGADPRLALLLREALARGEIVALQGDRPRQGGKTVAAELFGRPYPIPAGPLILARQTGAPLLPAFVFRTGRRAYRLRFEAPIMVGTAGGDRAADLEAAAEQFLAGLERAVRRAPHQWFVFRELWPEDSTKPQGAA